MTELQSILLVTRARQRNGAAVELAMRLAQQHEARLTISDSIDTSRAGDIPGPGTLLKRLKQRRRMRELESLSDHEPFGFLPMVCVLDGERVDTTLELIGFGDYDLIIVDLAAHGNERLSSQDIERLEHGCPVPILFVPADAAANMRRIAIAVDPEDESALATSCLELGGRLARGGEVKMHVVSAYQPFVRHAFEKSASDAETSACAQTETWVHERQLDLIDSIGLDPQIIRTDQIQGRVERALPTYASDHDIDVVIVGHKRRSKLPGAHLQQECGEAQRTLSRRHLDGPTTSSRSARRRFFWRRRRRRSGQDLADFSSGRLIDSSSVLDRRSHGNSQARSLALPSEAGVLITARFVLPYLRLDEPRIFGSGARLFVLRPQSASLLVPGGDESENP